MTKKLDVYVQTIPQLKAVINSSADITRIYIDYFLFADDSVSSLVKSASEIDFYLVLPFMLREEKDLFSTEDIQKILAENNSLKGVLARNLEELGFLKSISYTGKVIGDYGVYIWNHGASDFLFNEEIIDEACIPYELNNREISSLLDKTTGRDFSMCIYGHIPMMISSGCLKKTTDSCSGKMGRFNRDITIMTDRKNNKLPVLNDCKCCLNVCYNAVPLSLHKQLSLLQKESGISNFRIDFTIEDENTTSKILAFWNDLLTLHKADCPYENYTTGHFKRGVE